MTDLPATLIDAVRYFSDAQTCDDYMRRIKWPDGVVACPACGASGERIGEIPARHKMQCKDCRRQFSYKVGTIFEDSPLGLDKWFVAVWSVANAKNGISSHELARAIGVTQKTAWFMLHRVRKAMEVDDLGGPFDGPSEADTTYIGGIASNMHKAKREKVIKGRGTVGKTAVHGVLQRTGDKPSRVRCAVVERDDAETLLAEVRRHVKRGETICTDAAASYNSLMATHEHQVIDHSIEYVRGHVHTNGLENFWSLFKRAIKGTYVAIARFHLFRYVGEQVFRFNQRTDNDAGRFATVMGRVVGKRLTFRVLCGIDGAGFMGIE